MGPQGCHISIQLPCLDRSKRPLQWPDLAEEQRKAEKAGEDILRLCVEVGGCLTGEHGVGIEKRDLMRVQFTETELALQMSIKTALDPQWLLNPAKVFPLDGRPAEAA